MIETIARIKTEIRKSIKVFRSLERTLERQCAEDPENPLRKLKMREFNKLVRITDYPLFDPLLVLDDRFLKLPVHSAYRSYLEEKGLWDLVVEADFTEVFENGLPNHLLKEDLEDNEQDDKKFKLTKNVRKWLKFSGRVRGSLFGEGLDELSLHPNEDLRKLIVAGKLPPFMIRYIVLGRHERGALGVWATPGKEEDGTILLFDVDARTFKVVSRSMKNFANRAMDCHLAGTRQDWFRPSAEALRIIREIDGDETLPGGPTYSLDDVESWPEEWKAIASSPVDTSKITTKTVRDRALEKMDELMTDDIFRAIGFSEEQIRKMKEERARQDAKPRNSNKRNGAGMDKLFKAIRRASGELED